MRLVGFKFVVKKKQNPGDRGEMPIGVKVLQIAQT